MEPLNHRFRELGRTVAEVSDQIADPSVTASARALWLASSAPKPAAKDSRGWGWRWLPVTIAVAVACAIVIPAALQPKAIAFQVGSPPTPGQAGEWLGSDKNPMRVQFDEGTMLAVAPRARVRIVEATSDGATVLLERGRLQASVQHQGSQTAWAIHAGPFEVRVTGTKFETAWDPVAEKFELIMEEGSVILDGPLLARERQVTAGERVVASVREGRLEALAPMRASDPPAIVSAPAPADQAALPAPEPLAEDSLPKTVVAENPVAPVIPKLTASAATIANTPPASWQQLASTRKYKEALAQVEQRGFAQELEQASQADLFLLTDVARFSGQPVKARETLLAARRRFGAQGRSAFLLGKIAADQMGADNEALEWFHTYLSEEASGPLAEQALGRILEIQKRKGLTACAESERYLSQYPNGVYSALARSMCQKP